MPEKTRTSKNLNLTELKNIGELLSESRNQHLRMLDGGDAEHGRKLVQTLRVLFFEAKGYASDDYEDLLNEIRYQSSVLEQQSSLQRAHIEQVENLKDRVKSLLSDAGLSIEQERDLTFGDSNPTEDESVSDQN